MLFKLCSKLAFKYFRLVAFSLLVVVIPNTGNAVWIDVSPGAAVLNFTLAPSDPDTIFATTGLNDVATAGVWRSTNSGTAWTQVITNLDYKGAAVKPDNASVVLAGVNAGGIQRSTNGGVSGWAATGSATSENWVFGFSASTPTTVYAGGNTGPGSGAMTKSIDSGASWTSITTIGADASPAIYSIAVDPTNANIVYVGARPGGALDDGLYVSINGGTSWTLLTGMTYTQVDTLAIDPNDSMIIYAGTSLADEIRRSTDGGATWTTIHKPSAGGIAGFTTFRGIAIDPDDSRVIYASGGSNNSAKVIASSDCGSTWTNVTSTGIGSTDLPSHIEIDSTFNFVYAVENLFSGIVYRSPLGDGLAAASGVCPNGTPPPGGGNPIPPAGGSSGGSSSIGYLFLGLLVFIGLVRVFRSKKSEN